MEEDASSCLLPSAAASAFGVAVCVHTLITKKATATSATVTTAATTSQMLRRLFKSLGVFY